MKVIEIKKIQQKLELFPDTYDMFREGNEIITKGHDVYIRVEFVETFKDCENCVNVNKCETHDFTTDCWDR
jgi:hypothetical protein